MNNDEQVCPECGTPLKERSEMREVGYWEIVYYCDGCGYCATD